MMKSTVLEEVKLASKSNHIVTGFNIFGYEDACEVVKAAELLKCPVFLMTNRDASRAMDVKHWGALLSSIAQSAKVPVSAHLDHNSDLKTIFRAIDSGYTSVMYDGSILPLEENIRNSQEVVEYAHAKGVFVECELGHVPYSDTSKASPIFTDIEDVKKFIKEVDVDMLAVSVGNIHRQTKAETKLNFDVLQQFASITEIPLVIHGVSGICQEDKLKMKKYTVGKINVGTELRMAFNKSLRESIAQNPKVFDRLKLFEKPRESVYESALNILKLMQ